MTKNGSSWRILATLLFLRFRILFESQKRKGVLRQQTSVWSLKSTGKCRKSSRANAQYLNDVLHPIHKVTPPPLPEFLPTQCGCYMRITPNVACVTLHTFSKLLSQQRQDRLTGIRKERDVSKGFTPSIPLLSLPDSFLREKRTNMVMSTVRCVTFVPSYVSVF